MSYRLSHTVVSRRRSQLRNQVGPTQHRDRLRSSASPQPRLTCIHWHRLRLRRACDCRGGWTGGRVGLRMATSISLGVAGARAGLVVRDGDQSAMIPFTAAALLGTTRLEVERSASVRRLMSSRFRAPNAGKLAGTSLAALSKQRTRWLRKSKITVSSATCTPARSSPVPGTSIGCVRRGSTRMRASRRCSDTTSTVVGRSDPRRRFVRLGNATAATR